MIVPQMYSKTVLKQIKIKSIENKGEGGSETPIF
jgi:hypothetical protein